MRVAFLIHRKNYYRLLAPVIDEALRRGYQVECLHDWSHPRHGGKSYEFPDSTPAFHAGAPEIRTFQGLADLGERFRADSPDVVISLDPPSPDVKAGAKAKWLWLQYSVDILFYPSLQGILDADAVGTYSPHWIGRLEERHRHSGLAHEVKRKTVAVGMPELDAARGIDPEEVQQRLGLPAGRPVVLYLPYPLRSNPRTFWARQVFAPSTRLEQGARVLLGRRMEYWPHVRNGWNDRGLVKAVREFCDRNGALLVTKEREKDPAPGYLRRVSDRVLGDESSYPPTILELLRISSLCVHSYSTAAFEAAYCGVPSLCLAPDAADMGLRPDVPNLVHNGALGGIYNWPGAAYCAPLTEAFDGFRRWRLADFPLDAEARARYVKRFLGFDDGRSAGRLLDAARALTEEGRP